MDALAIAGFILNLIPVVAQAVEAYKDTNIRKEVQRLARSLRVIEANYRNCLERLLVDLKLNNVAQELLKDPGSSLWRDEQINRKLAVHLDGDYVVFQEAMEDIKELIQELHKAFVLKHRPSQRKIMKFLKSFVSRPLNEAGLNQLRYKVEELNRLTKESSALAAARYERSTPVLVYKNVRASATHLYEALYEGWSCQCETHHYANLLLETRQTSMIPGPSTQGTKERTVTRFRFLFSYQSVPGKDIPENNEQGSWMELEIEPIAEDVSLDKYREIKDLCAFIHDLERPVRSTRDCLGYLSPKGNSRPHGLFTVPESEAQSRRVVSLPLAKILSPIKSRSARVSGSHQTLSVAARVRLAVVLSSTMLQLHSTPWLDPIWSKDELRYFEPAQSEKYKKLYLQHRFESKRARANSLNSISPTSSNDSTLARMPSNEDNVPWAINETLYNLGILLLELSLGQSMEELTTSYFGPVPRDPSTDIRTIALAFRSRSMEVEMGSVFHNAVYSCIHCNFDLPYEKMILNDDDFQRNVLKKIIRPLEECSKNFSYI